MYITAPTTQQIDTLTVEQSVHTYNLAQSRQSFHAKARTRQKNMIKQKICGVFLALCGVVPIVLEGDATAFVFLAMFFLPMIFGKQYIMTFKE